MARGCLLVGQLCPRSWRAELPSGLRQTRRSCHCHNHSIGRPVPIAETHLTRFPLFLRQCMMAILAASMLILVYSSDLNNDSTFHGVLMSMCGKRAQQLSALSILLTCYGVCVAFLIIIGDQYDRSKRPTRLRQFVTSLHFPQFSLRTSQNVAGLSIADSPSASQQYSSSFQCVTSRDWTF